MEKKQPWEHLLTERYRKKNTRTGLIHDDWCGWEEQILKQGGDGGGNVIRAIGEQTLSNKWHDHTDQEGLHRCW